MVWVLGDRQVVDNILRCDCARNTHESIRDSTSVPHSVYVFLGTRRDCDARGFLAGVCGELVRLRAEDNSDLLTIT